MKRQIFREYDIRGVADRDLTDDVVRNIGHGLAIMLSHDGAAPTIAVGRDCRLSGPRIVDQLVDGLNRGGANVVNVGVGPTPLLYFAVHHLDADGGVMITGSHNPGDENGFKIMRGKASFFGNDIQSLRQRIEDADLPLAATPGIRREENVHDAYLDRLLSSVSIGSTDLEVVIDAGNGAAGPTAVALLEKLGIGHSALYCEMDGTFPNHHPDPTVPENLTELTAELKKRGARVGIAFDGDGDRLGVVDPTGEIVWGDRLLALFARDLLVDHPGAAVIGEVKCSQNLFDDIERQGGRPIMWKTGHSLIKTKMKEEGALLAGEMSGHFFFADRYLGFDDAPYAMLRLIETLSKGPKTVAERLADLPKGRSTPEIRVSCPDDVKTDVVAQVRTALSARHETSEIDGVRVKYPDGAWALVRASNTGPVIVLRFEAPTDERLATIRDEVEQLLAEARDRLEGSG